MSNKYKGKFRSETTRLKSWDYGWNGAYFVTICCKDRECFFGEVVRKRVILSKIGKTTESYWKEIPKHFPFVRLGEFVVMPNHVHGIIHIEKENDGHNAVGTQNLASLRVERKQPLNKFGPQSQNLGSIIRGFKTGVTKSARKIRNDFKWQSRYYDHIIRDRESLARITEYINRNPENWEDDELSFQRNERD